MTPCVCMKLITINEIYISWCVIWIRSPSQRL